MSEQSERLFSILSHIQDRHIDRAGRYMGKKHRPWRRWTALAACLVLLLGLGVVLPRLGGSVGSSGSGSNGASTFMSYAGPVMPLTLKEETSAITAQRAITLNFEPWVPVWETNEERLEGRTDLDEEQRQKVLEDYQEIYPEGGRYQYSSDILVTDSYTLNNSTQEDQTVTLLYPFTGQLRYLGAQQPVLTVEGQELETALRVGAYAGSFEGAWSGALEGDEEGSVNLNYAESWEDYRDTLADGSYAANALGEAPDVRDWKVTVYRFTDPYGPEANEEAGIPNPSIRVGFDLDYDRTTILGYGFHFGSYDQENGTMIQGFSIPEEGEPRYGQPFYLLVVGEDIQNMTIEGYVTGGSDGDTPVLEDCGVTVERYESDLDTMLRQLLTQSMEEQIRWEELAPGLDFEVYYRAFLEHLLAYGVLSPQGMERYGAGWIEEMTTDVQTVDRVCWLEAQVTVPASGSLTVVASMTKAGSFDYACADTENRGVYGYDFVTSLGSNLACTRQTATLEDRGQITIVRQNFGFDLERGIQTVELDPGTEHYYLEVKRLAGTLPQNAPEN
ncbi:hypothetical protein [Flavonifractor sp. An100]|uniref:hypothetical protein n=1 Tax=Flavonifractor sp. An100 TaxID=1965538 RepID=UPI000B3A689C|nr:hypothetical protein [Flavonifractor sp. An100]OUQ81593.1 hypothetical protein B5E43_01555 [Flavonifractor sp. An100]